MQLVSLLLMAGALLAVLGYRIRFRREWHLIGLFDFARVRDPERFGNWVGSVGLLLGSTSFAAAAVAFTRPDLNQTLGAAYTAFVLASTAALILGALRYIF